MVAGKDASVLSEVLFNVPAVPREVDDRGWASAVERRRSVEVHPTDSMPATAASVR